MEHFDFHGPAELFAASGPSLTRQKLSYKRFETGAEAIKYAMEIIGADHLRGVSIETETVRLQATQINELYRRSDYPLCRLEK
ncbi:MAG: hypothetical protein NW217_16520 [Hyphomicrobiaceae bacterium]|nr:hypothetical protein [Hyphomicrobiaceae bacterium]